LENVGFQLLHFANMSLKRLLCSKVPFNLTSYPTQPFPDDHPITRSSKNIQRNNKVPSTKHTNNCASTLTLKGLLRQITMIIYPKFGCIITLNFGIRPNTYLYMITIGSFPDYSCPYFKEIMTKTLDKRGQWANCKHLYFILTVILR
jgi:hypothetical protein